MNGRALTVSEVSSGYGGEDILHDVAHIDPPLNSLVEPKLHHSSQRIAMPVHQAVDRVLVATLGIGEQILRFFRIRPHKRIIESG